MKIEKVEFINNVFEAILDAAKNGNANSIIIDVEPTNQEQHIMTKVRVVIMPQTVNCFIQMENGDQRKVE